ncbi:pilus assembly protein [Myxococcaceae bacterium GXIMD 01537]
MARRNVKRRGARGQALVELVLGVIVFVTVLMFCIHFAEIGFLSVKVTEAQYSAIFDATGHKLHRWPNNADLAKSAASKAGSDAQSRYQDFDSRTRASGKSLSQVFTRASDMRVQCQTGGGGKGPKYEQGSVTNGAYSDNGGINCQASARLTAFDLPERFMDQGDLFATQHYKPRPIRVCGIGRANCSARLAMLLDDWGLSGAQESKNCTMSMDSPGCQNQPFFDMAEKVYKNNGGSMGMMGTAFAVRIVGMSPVNESQFWMSAPGEEKSFNQKISSEGTTQFLTSPYLKEYQKSHSQRKDCFLGKCP